MLHQRKNLWINHILWNSEFLGFQQHMCKRQTNQLIVNDERTWKFVDETHLDTASPQGGTWSGI